MGLDFYGVQIAAWIKVPKKLNGAVGGPVEFSTYQLWVNQGNTEILRNLGLDSLAYVQDVTVQVGMGLNSKVALTLSLPLEEGLSLIHSPLISWGASELKLTIGYSTGDNATSYEFGGLMMKPDVRIGQGVTVTLNAMGVAYGMNLSNATSERTFPSGWSPWKCVRTTIQNHTRAILESDAQVFPDLTPEQMDEKNPNAHEFFKPITIKNVANPEEVKKQTAQIRENAAKRLITKAQADEQIAQLNESLKQEKAEFPLNKGPRNDWWFIRETIKRYGLDLIVLDNKIRIRLPEKWKLGSPKYKFVLKGQMDTSAPVPVYPILELNSPSSFVYLAPGVGGTVIADVTHNGKEPVKQVNAPYGSSKTKELAKTSPSRLTAGGFIAAGLADIKEKVIAKSVPISRTAEGAYNAGKNGQPDAMEVIPGSPDSVLADQAVSALKQYNNDRGIQVEITTLGIPTLLPADIVYVDGLQPERAMPGQKAAWFNGIYGVMTVEHNIGTGGMITKFRGIKNGFPGDQPAGTDKPNEMGGQINKSKPTEVPQGYYPNSFNQRKIPK